MIFKFSNWNISINCIFMQYLTHQHFASHWQECTENMLSNVYDEMKSIFPHNVPLIRIERLLLVIEGGIFCNSAEHFCAILTKFWLKTHKLLKKNRPANIFRAIHRMRFTSQMCQFVWTWFTRHQQEIVCCFCDVKQNSIKFAFERSLRIRMQLGEFENHFIITEMNTLYIIGQYWTAFLRVKDNGYASTHQILYVLFYYSYWVSFIRTFNFYLQTNCPKRKTKYFDESNWYGNA